jgi:hypothetical protein
LSAFMRRMMADGAATRYREIRSRIRHRRAKMSATSSGRVT